MTHSELNAILNYQGGSLEGAKLYVTLFPCNECAKAIIQSGIKTVVYGSAKYADTPAVRASKRMMDAAGVRYYQYNEDETGDPDPSVDDGDLPAGNRKGRDTVPGGISLTNEPDSARIQSVRQNGVDGK